MSAGLGFPRARRLRKRREYLGVQGSGRKVSGAHYLFFVRRRAMAGADGVSGVAGGARFGITVTRKVGNAVVRNRVKRVVREGCRHTAALFPVDVDVVVVARPTAAGADSAAARGELVWLARKLAPRSAP